MKLGNIERRFMGIFRGQVVDNNDPLRLGRVRVQVYPVFAGITEIEALPWAVPAFPLFAGSGSGFGCFMVPKVGTTVFVFFENNDYLQPVYFAEAPDGVHGLPSEREINYPKRKVWKLSSGIVLYMDDESMEVKLNHPSGSYIFIDGSGNVVVNGKDITIQGDNVYINP